MPSHNRHALARLLTVTCVVALLAAITIVAVFHDSGHPPERVAAARPDVVINPVALPDAATTTTTTVVVDDHMLLPPPPTTAPAHPRRVPAVSPAPTSEIDQIIVRWFGPLYDQARRVAVCESSLDPTAIGGNNYGLFQINRVHADDFANVTGVAFDEGWSDPNLNAQYAAHLHDEQGWGPWSCKP